MKLYWRYKKDGKWSWKPATLTEDSTGNNHGWELSVVVDKLEEEE